LCTQQLGSYIYTAMLLIPHGVDFSKGLRMFFSRVTKIIKKYSENRKRDLLIPQESVVAADTQNAPIPARAGGKDFLGRFREIVSDPVNLLIERHPLAGCVVDGQVILLNGNRVAATGPYSYYNSFSAILVINRGVHEPLEEYVFQELIKKLPHNPCMLELGAYWAHYSLWLKSKRPDAANFIVEPVEKFLKIAKRNFANHGFAANFIQAKVGNDDLKVDDFVIEQSITKIHVLHSDIQGFELQMLEGAAKCFENRVIDYCVISTHTEALHEDCKRWLTNVGYVIEVQSAYENETTSSDGLIFARSPNAAPVLPKFRSMGRTEICKATPRKLVQSLSSALNLPI
jgi:Methyltransferase FkbM domain